MSDELTTVLRALVTTQEEIVDALAEVSEDVRALERRLDLLETAAGLRAEARQAQAQTREGRCRTGGAPAFFRGL